MPIVREPGPETQTVEFIEYNPSDEHRHIGPIRPGYCVDHDSVAVLYDDGSASCHHAEVIETYMDCYIIAAKLILLPEIDSVLLKAKREIRQAREAAKG